MNNTLYVAFVIYYINIVVNVIASMLTLVLFSYMRRNGNLRMNLYLKCVVLMTIFQGIYDASLSLALPCGSKTTNYTCSAFWVSGFFGGGIGASVWSLMIIIAATFTVYYGREPTKKEAYIVFVLVNMLVLAWTIFGAIVGYNANSDRKYFGTALFHYNNMRIAIIVFTAAALAWMLWLVRKVTAKSEQKLSPLYHLVKRLAVYPIIQVVCRLGVAPYNLMYKESLATHPANTDNLRDFLLYVWVIFTPLAGLGAFLAFILMQKNAKESLRNIFCATPATMDIDHSRESMKKTTPLSSIQKSSSKSNQGGGTGTITDDDTGQRKSSSVPWNPEENYTYCDNAGEQDGASRTSSHVVEDEDDISRRLSCMDEGDLVRQYLEEMEAEGGGGRLPPGRRRNSKRTGKTGDAVAEGVSLGTIQVDASTNVSTATNPITRHIQEGGSCSCPEH